MTKKVHAYKKNPNFNKITKLNKIYDKILFYCLCWMIEAVYLYFSNSSVSPLKIIKV